MFRQEVAAGLADATRTVNAAGADEKLVLFAMWTETIRDTVERGKGNVIFLDGSVQGMEESLKRLAALQQIEANRSSENTSAQARS